MDKPEYVEADPDGHIAAIVWSCGCAWDKDTGPIVCAKHRRHGYDVEAETVISPTDRRHEG